MRDWVPLLVAGCALVAALVNMRGTLRQAGASQESNQIKWLQEAKDDAHKAKAEADRAKTEADEVHEESALIRRQLNQTRREVAELRDLVEELTGWALRVIAAKSDPNITLPELRQVIDHGPPSIRSTARKIDPA
jgi:hypothetical protein